MNHIDGNPAACPCYPCRMLTWSRSKATVNGRPQPDPGRRPRRG